MLALTTRTRAVMTAAGLTMGCWTAAALAAPPVLDRVPDNAMLVVAGNSADTIQKNIQALVTAAELPIPAVPKIEDLLAGAGITQGLDTGKSFAVVVFAPTPEQMAGKKTGMKMNAKPGHAPGIVEGDHPNGDKPGADKGGKPGVGEPDAADEKDIDDGDDDDADSDKDQPVVILVPITNYADVLKNFDVKAGGGIDPVTMPDGKQNYMRDVGNGYAALGPNKDLIAKFESKSGPSALKSKLGAAGEKLADTLDLMAIVNMDAVRPLWPELKKHMSKAIKDQAAALPMGDAAPNPMDNPMVTWLTDGIVRDGRSFVGGIKTGNTGVNMDFTVNFTAGSPMAQMFTGGSKAGSLLAKLPSLPYLFAGAFDASSPQLKSFFKELMGKGGTGQTLGIAGSPKRVENTEGTAVVVGVPTGGIFAGLTTATVIYTKSKDVPALLAAQKEDINALNGKQQDAVTMESTYKDASAKVDGVDVDEYSVKFKVDPNSEAGEMAPQALTAIFGPAGGPTGYIARVDGGLYQTFGKNSDLLSKAMKADKGGENLGSDLMMKQVGDSMPESRIAEGYIGIKGLLDLLVPAAAVFTGMQIPPDQIPDSLPPIGAAISGANGSAHMSLFVPAPVIKTGAKLAMSLQEQMGGGDDAPDAADKADPKGKGGKPGTGQPRF